MHRVEEVTTATPQLDCYDLRRSGRAGLGNRRRTKVIPSSAKKERKIPFVLVSLRNFAVVYDYKLQSAIGGCVVAGGYNPTCGIALERGAL